MTWGYVGEDGRKMAWRTLFRSDSLDRLTETGVRTFLGLGIHTVVDLGRGGFLTRQEPEPKRGVLV